MFSNINYTQVNYFAILNYNQILHNFHVIQYICNINKEYFAYDNTCVIIDTYFFKPLFCYFANFYICYYLLIICKTIYNYTLILTNWNYWKYIKIIAKGLSVPPACKHKTEESDTGKTWYFCKHLIIFMYTLIYIYVYPSK